MSSLAHLTKVNDICLFVRDFKASLKFYTEVFGFQIKRLQPDPEHANYVEFEFQGASVTMWDKQGVLTVLPEEVLGGDGHHFMIAVKVPHIDHVDEIYEELTRNGANCISKPTTYEFGSRAAYFQDLEQNIWEVFAWVEGNGPGLL